MSKPIEPTFSAHTFLSFLATGLEVLDKPALTPEEEGAIRREVEEFMKDYLPD